MDSTFVNPKVAELALASLDSNSQIPFEESSFGMQEINYEPDCLDTQTKSTASQELVSNIQIARIELVQVNSNILPAPVEPRGVKRNDMIEDYETIVLIG